MTRTPTRRALLLGAMAAGAAGCLPNVAMAQARKYPAFGRIERLDPALDALVDRNAVVEQILDGFSWSEGPVWIGGPSGMLLMSDPRDNVIRRWSAATGGTTWLKPSGYAGTDLARYREPGTNGLIVARGGLVAADSGMRAITRIDLKTRKKTIIADRFEGKRFNSPNDVCLSPVNGSLYFTDPPYGLTGVQDSPDREMDYTGVFRVAPDNQVSLIGKYRMPNGIGVSPDGQTLYHTDGDIGWVAHQLDGEGRSLAERSFVDRTAQGIAGASGDGLKVDQRGNLWMTGRDGISIVTPAGRRIGIIRIDDVVSNCEFGADGHLYMTCGKRIGRLPVKARKVQVRA